MSIKARIDMLGTGIKPQSGKIAGPDLEEIERIRQAIERTETPIDGAAASAFSERVAGGRYIKVQADRLAAARFRLNVDDINRIVATAISGSNLNQTVEGLERYPINIRLQREQRDSVQKLRELPIFTPTGPQVPLSKVPEVVITDYL